MRTKEDIKTAIEWIKNTLDGKDFLKSTITLQKRARLNNLIEAFEWVLNEDEGVKG